MALITVLVVILHAMVSALNFRLGFFLFVFFYGTYPRLFAIGAGDEGFALTAQRLMLLTLALLFGLRFLYGSEDVRHAIRLMRQHVLFISLFCGLLIFRLLGNIMNGRLDLAAIVTFGDGIVSILLLVIFVFATIRTKKDVRVFLFVLALSLVPNQLVAIVEYWQQESIFPQSLSLEFETSLDQATLIQGGERYGEYRVMGTFDNTLKLMEVCILLLPILVYLMLTSRDALGKVLIFAIFLMTPVVIVWTGSRTGLMLLFLIASYYSYHFMLKKFGRLEGYLLLSVAGSLGLLALFFSLDSIINSFLFGSEGAKSTASRFLQYAISLPLIAESPWLGYGFARNIVDIIDIETGIDGYYLRTVLEGGLLSLACLVGLYFISLRSLSRLQATVTGDLYHLSMAIYLSLGLSAIMMLALNMGTGVTYVFMFFALTVVIAEDAAPVKAQYRQNANPATAQPFYT